MRKTSQLPLSVRRTPTSSSSSSIKTKNNPPIVNNNNQISNGGSVPPNSTKEFRIENEGEAIHLELREDNISALMNQLNNDHTTSSTNKIPIENTPPNRGSNRMSGSSEKTVSLTKLLGKSKPVTSPKTSPKNDGTKGSTSPPITIEMNSPIPENDLPSQKTPPIEIVIPQIKIPISVYSQPLQRIEIDDVRESPPPLPPDSPMSFALLSPISVPSSPFTNSPLISPRMAQQLLSFNTFSPTRMKTPKRNLVELNVHEMYNNKSITKIEKINAQFDLNNEESYEWNILCSNIRLCKKTLQEITLKKCSLEDEKHLMPFFDTLIENDVKLRVLDLEGNKMSSESCSYLGEYLFMSRESLQTINLRNNPLTDEGMWKIVQSFKESSERSGIYSQITEMDISGTQLSDEGLLCLALFSKDYLPNLTSLKCFGNYITNINVIRDLVKDSGKLRHIDFWKNSIQVESLSRLATSSANIVSLNLGCNLIGDKGVVVLSKYLSFSKKLRCLDLSGNEIRDGGGFHLANGILVNCGLTLLNLGNNFLTESSVSRIIDCLKNHPSLSNLSIARNRIDPLKIPDLNRYVSDVNSVRKRLGYPICKTFISTCIEPFLAPVKSTTQTQTLTNSSSESLDDDFTLSVNTPRTTVSTMELEGTLSPSLNLTPPVHQNFLTTKSIQKNSSSLSQSNSSHDLQEEVETIQEALKTLKQNREAKLREQTMESQSKNTDSDIESMTQKDLVSNASRTSTDIKMNGSKFMISLLLLPPSVSLPQEKDDSFYIKFTQTQSCIKRQRKLFKKTKTIITGEVANIKIEQSPQSRNVFSLNICGEPYGVKILNGKDQEFIYSFYQHQEMSQINFSNDLADSDTASSNTELFKSKKSKDFQSPTRRMSMSALKKVSSVASFLGRKKNK